MKTGILKAVGILLFGLIIWKIGISELLALLSRVNILYLVPILFIIILVQIITAIRWKLILRNHGIEYSYKDAVLAYLATSYLGYLTPARIGEVAKVFYLKQDLGVGIGAGATSVFLDRMYSLFVLLMAAFLGLMMFSVVDLTYQAILILTVLMGGLLIVTNKRLVKGLTKKLFMRFVPERQRGSIEKHFDDFYTNLYKTKPKEMVVSLLLTLAAYALMFFQAHLLAGLLGLDISYLFVMTNLAVANLVNLLPISISAGIGTRDLVMILLFTSHGLKESEAVAFATLILSTVVIISLVGLVCWWIKPLKKK